MREPMRRSITFVAACLAACLATALPASAASDPYRPRQWALDRIQADKAWSVSRGAGVTIAIVDTGIDLSHPDLKGKITGAYACVSGACSAGGDDDNGHGSHVAGIAAAATGNGVGISGVAPAAKLMAVKVLDSDGSGACSDIELGIRWAADHGARVVNLSLGPGLFTAPTGFLCTNGLQQAAAYAWNAGSVVVIAAGNDSLVSLYSSNDLLVVGATGPDDDLASYSNSGANIYAPGGDSGSSSCRDNTCIFSTWEDGGYADAQGTSMAAPHVSGVAALLLARGYTNAQVLSRIRSTADNVNGFLRVNAARAVGSSTPIAVQPRSPSGSKPSGSKQSPAGSSPSTNGTVAPAASGIPTMSPTGSATPGAGSENASSSPQAAGATTDETSSSNALRIAIAALAAALLTAAAVRIAIHRRTVRAGSDASD
jgi:serine protease